MDVRLKEVHAGKRDAPRWVYPKGYKVGDRWIQPRGYMSTTRRSYDAKPRLYVWVDGENMLENFAYRENRPSKLYRKFLPEIFATLGLPADTKATWSQKAGCGCGCSPGFILDIAPLKRRNLTDRTPRRMDFHATLVGEEAKVDEVDERVAYRAERGVEVLVEGRL